jgi:hypothetical protein
VGEGHDDLIYWDIRCHVYNRTNRDFHRVRSIQPLLDGIAGSWYSSPSSLFHVYFYFHLFSNQCRHMLPGTAAIDRPRYALYLKGRFNA